MPPAQIGGYKLEKKLGKGAFGEVWQAKKGIITVAIKCIKKHGNLSNGVEKEVGALKRCNHENIVNYIGLLTDSDFAYIIMEFCAGGSFRNFLHSKGTISEAGTKVVFRQLAKALGYLNQHQIIHRDLKPDNILMKDQRNYSIKIADFGIAKLVFDEFGTDNAVKLLKQSHIEIYGTPIGTPYYLAPEILTKKYNAKVDLWSAGAILYECLFGYYKMINMVNELHTHHRDISDRLIGGNVSVTCNDLLKRLMVYDQTRRIGVDEFVRHQFHTCLTNHKNILKIGSTPSPSPQLCARAPTPFLRVQSPQPILRVQSPQPILCVRSPQPILCVQPPQPILCVRPHQHILCMRPPQPFLFVRSPQPQPFLCAQPSPHFFAGQINLNFPL